jgi:hypothetical protein
MANVTITTPGLKPSGGVHDLKLKLESGFLPNLYRASLAWSTLRGTIIPVENVAGRGRSVQTVLDGFNIQTTNAVEGNEQDSRVWVQTGTDTELDPNPITDSMSITMSDAATTYYIDELVTNRMRRMADNVAAEYDQRIFNAIANAAVTAAQAGIHNGGNSVVHTAADEVTAFPNNATGGDRLINYIYDLAKLFDEDDVPDTDRNLILSPHGARVALNATEKPFDRNFSNTTNDLNKRYIGELAGFKVWRTNRLPAQNFTADGAGSTRIMPAAAYRGNFTPAGIGQPIALALCGGVPEPAVKGVTLGDPQILMADSRQATHFIKYDIRTYLLEGYSVVYPTVAGAILTKAS